MVFRGEKCFTVSIFLLDAFTNSRAFIEKNQLTGTAKSLVTTRCDRFLCDVPSERLTYFYFKRD
jgi:hypothetical protein